MTEIGAADILRGVARALSEADQAVLPEVPLANGRRADLLALDRSGRLTLVEIKSCRADFVADRKWQSYLDYCDRFYFAVAAGFPVPVNCRKSAALRRYFTLPSAALATHLPP